MVIINACCCTHCLLYCSDHCFGCVSNEECLCVGSEFCCKSGSNALWCKPKKGVYCQLGLCCLSVYFREPQAYCRHNIQVVTYFEKPPFQTL